jgi:hypothetical protein
VRSERPAVQRHLHDLASTHRELTRPSDSSPPLPSLSENLVKLDATRRYRASKQAGWTIGGIRKIVICETFSVQKSCKQ